MNVTMRKILFVPQMLGIFPFEFDRNRLKLSKKYLFLTALNIGFLSYCLVITLLQLFGRTSFQKVVLLSQVGPTLLTVLFSHSLPFMKIKSIRRILQEMRLCTVLLEKLEVPLKTSKLPDASTYSTMFLCLVFGWIQFSKSPIVFVIMAYSITVIFQAAICFVTAFIDSLEMIFGRLKIALIKNRRCKQKDICQIINAHNKLVDVKEALDKVFAPIILAAVTTSFVIVTENVYMTLTEFRNDRFDYTRLFYVVLYSIPTWKVVSSCTTVTIEISDFHSLLYRLCKKDKNVLTPLVKYSSVVAELTLQKYSAKLMDFKAYGFVTIDRSLLGRMLSSSVTLLTILIQFGG